MITNYTEDREYAEAMGEGGRAAQRMIARDAIRLADCMARVGFMRIHFGASTWNAPGGRPQATITGRATYRGKSYQILLRTGDVALYTGRNVRISDITRGKIAGMAIAEHFVGATKRAEAKRLT